MFFWHPHEMLRKYKTVPLQQPIARSFFPWLGTGLLLWASPGLTSAAWAQPIIPTADGTGSIVLQTGDRFDITGGNLSANGQNLFHSFERFGLGLDQTANFVASPEIRNILGRVTGGEASYIDGLVQVGNGTANLMLINPAGILTGVNSRIEAPGSFTATTADWLGFDGQWVNVLEAGAFAAQDAGVTGFGFSATAPGAIISEGQIQVGTGQQLRLIGGTVLNTGELNAPEGEMTLLSVQGESTANFGGDGAIALGPSLPGQAPLLMLQPLPDLLLGRTANQASTIAVSDIGNIQLLGQVIPVEPGVTITSGELDVSGEQAGLVEVLGDRVGLLSANLTASGLQGGGEVLIGGDYQGQGQLPNAQRAIVDASSTIKADALTTGNGGRIILWADGTTQFAGAISARGGDQSGEGGFVEVSGKEQLAFRGNVDVTAPQGLAGTLLLDPERIRIVDGSGGANDAALSDGVIALTDSDVDGVFTISETALEALSGNVILEASEEIVLEDLSDNLLALDNVESIIFKLQTSDRLIREQFAIADGNDQIQTQGGDVGIVSDNIELGSIRTNGGDIVLGNTLSDSGLGTDNIGGSSSVKLIDNVSLSSDGGLIRVGGSITGESAPRNLTVIAGTGDIDLGSIGHSSGNIQNLQIIGQELTLGGSSVQADDSILIQAAGPLALGSNTRVEAGGGLILFAQSLNTAAPQLTSGGNLVLLSQEDLTLNRFANLDSDAGTTVGVDAGSLTLENFNASGSVSPGHITLEASENLTIEGSTLSATGSLSLLAGQKITLKDSGNPLRLDATSDLYLQGDSGIRIEGYRHFDSALNADANLRLISDGPIVVDAILNQGGSFFAEDTAGNPADLTATTANFVGRISASGDVTFGNYEGPSLRVEAGGSITGGDISIFAPNPNITGPESSLFQSTDMPSVFLRAGVESLTLPENAPLTLPAGGTTLSATTTASPAASIQVGNINTAAGGFDYGPIELSAPGDISVGDLTTRLLGSLYIGDTIYRGIRIDAGGAVQAGDLATSQMDITVLAQGDIQAGDIDTNGFANQSGVRLVSDGGSIQVNTIDTGSGGIYVEAADLFQALGSFTESFQLRPTDPALLDYLESLGHDRTLLETAALASSNSTSVGNVSLIARPSSVDAGEQYMAPIEIRFGDQARTILDQTPEGLGDAGRVLILGDSQDAFVAGAVFEDNPTYKPVDPANDIADFDPVTNNFDFQFTATPGATLVHGADEFPATASGFAAGVTIGAGTNSDLFASLQEQSFGLPEEKVAMNPTPTSTPTPAPVPTPATPTPAPTPASTEPTAPTESGPSVPTEPTQPQAEPENTSPTVEVAADVRGEVRRSGDAAETVCDSEDDVRFAELAAVTDVVEDKPEQIPCKPKAAPTENDALLRGIAPPNLPPEAVAPGFAEEG